jgi:hypothetical protein
MIRGKENRSFHDVRLTRAWHDATTTCVEESKAACRHIMNELTSAFLSERESSTDNKGEAGCPFAVSFVADDVPG